MRDQVPFIYQKNDLIFFLMINHYNIIMYMDMIFSVLFIFRELKTKITYGQAFMNIFISHE